MEDVEHVGDGRAGGRGHDSDRFWETGDGAFAGGVEEPLVSEFALERLEFRREQPGSRRLHEADVELVLAARFVDGEHAAHVDAHSFGKRDAGLAQAGPEEQNARKLAAVVLEREILVTGGLFAQVADFPLDPYFADGPLDEFANRPRQLGDGEDLRSG